MKHILLMGYNREDAEALIERLEDKKIAAGGVDLYSVEVIRNRNGWAQIMALAKNRAVAHQSHEIAFDTIEEQIDEMVSRGYIVVTIGNGCCIAHDHWEFHANTGWKRIISGS